MKLNLIPQGAKKSATMPMAWITAISLVLVSAGAAAFMAFTAQQQLNAQKDRAAQATPNALQAVAVAKQAQMVVDSTRGYATNLDLAGSIMEHNQKYTTFYEQVRPYIPGFLRLTQMSVEPVDEKSCNLILSGVLYSAQQYADATLALYRIPGARAVSRDGYAPRPVLVPGLTEEDQVGRTYRVGGAPLPEDPLERIAFLAAQANNETSGFQNLNNFGVEEPLARGPMNTGSNVNFTVLLAADDPSAMPEGWDFNFLVPNATATIQSIGTAAAAAATGAPAAAPGAPAGLPPGTSPEGGRTGDL